MLLTTGTILYSISSQLIYLTQLKLDSGNADCCWKLTNMEIPQKVKNKPTI